MLQQNSSRMRAAPFQNQTPQIHITQFTIKKDKLEKVRASVFYFLFIFLKVAAIFKIVLWGIMATWQLLRSYLRYCADILNSRVNRTLGFYDPHFGRDPVLLKNLLQMTDCPNNYLGFLQGTEINTWLQCLLAGTSTQQFYACAPSCFTQESSQIRMRSKLNWRSVLKIHYIDYWLDLMMLFF